MAEARSTENPNFRLGFPLQNLADGWLGMPVTKIERAMENRQPFGLGHGASR